MRDRQSDPEHGAGSRLVRRGYGEQLYGIGQASGSQRRRANGGVLVSGHVDDRHRNARCFKTVRQLMPDPSPRLTSSSTQTTPSNKKGRPFGRPFEACLKSAQYFAMTGLEPPNR